MALTPYLSTLATGARTDATTETYDLSTRGRKGLLLVHDVTVIGNGHSFVNGADVAVPVTISAGVNDTFKFNTNEFTIAPGTYTTLTTLAAAIGAALHTATAFSASVTVTVNAGATGLVFTSVASGVHAEAFAVGTTDALVAVLGITDAWTIAHTQAAGADGAYSATITILGKDEASGKFYTILAGAAQTGVNTKVLQVHPQMADSANLVAAALLPATIRVQVTHTTNNAITRTLSTQLVS